jgi:hypothetical protein
LKTFWLVIVRATHFNLSTYKVCDVDYARRSPYLSAIHPEAFILLAAAQGYTFTIEDLPTHLSQLSDEEVAAIFNPGTGTRRHLFPR